MNRDLHDAVLRLTTPRPFEPDYPKHLARLEDDERATQVVAQAGYDTSPASLYALRRRLDAGEAL